MVSASGHIPQPPRTSRAALAAEMDSSVLMACTCVHMSWNGMWGVGYWYVFNSRGEDLG